MNPQQMPYCLMRLAISGDEYRLMADYGRFHQVFLPLAVDHLDEQRRDALIRTGEFLSPDQQAVAEALLLSFNLPTALAHAAAACYRFCDPVQLPRFGLDGVTALAKPRLLDFAAAIGGDPGVLYFIVKMVGSHVTAVAISISNGRPLLVVTALVHQLAPAQWTGPVVILL